MLRGLNDENLKAKNIASNGLIFFVQRWTELTYPKTIDTYQYSILNCYFSARECLEVINKTLNGVYDSNININETLSELLKLLKEENNVIKNNSIGLYKSMLNLAGRKVKERHTLNFIKSRLEYSIIILDKNYENWIKKDIRKAIFNEDYSLINGLIKTLVSQCLNKGWSIKGLFELYKSFFSRKYDEEHLLDRFLNILFSENKTYTVYMKVKNINIEKITNAQTLLNKFEINIESGKDLMAINDKLKKPIIDKSAYYFVRKEKAKDAYSAALLTTEHNKKIFELLTFYNEIDSWPLEGTQYYTIDENEMFKHVKVKDFYGTYLYVDSNNMIFEKTVEILSQAKNEYKQLQIELQGVYAYVNISKLSMYQEEKFLNLWIAIESIMNTGEYNNIISHMKKVLPAIMSSQYIYRIIRNLSEDFIRVSIDYEEREDLSKHKLVEELIKKIKNDSEYLDLLNKCSKNKLLEFRLKEIKELLKDSNSIKDKIDRYHQTITWHIQRLYRLRNEITHESYLCDKNITPYIEHIHEFISILIIEIIYICSEKDICNISNIFALIKDSYEIFINETKLFNNVENTGIVECI